MHCCKEVAIHSCFACSHNAYTFHYYVSIATAMPLWRSFSHKCLGSQVSFEKQKLLLEWEKAPPLHWSAIKQNILLTNQSVAICQPGQTQLQRHGWFSVLPLADASSPIASQIAFSKGNNSLFYNLMPCRCELLGYFVWRVVGWPANF